MLYQRFIEVGRVCYIRIGDHTGKICTVVDLVDQKHLLVDGPTSGVPRCVLRLNQVSLTDLKIDIPRGCKSKKVRSELTKEDINAKFLTTSLSKKAEGKKSKALLGDFGRFKSRVSKTSLNRKIRTLSRKLKKSS